MEDRIDIIKQKVLAERAAQYNDASRERLKKIVITKIRTTMIGALSAIEKKFGFLWGMDCLEAPPEHDCDTNVMKQLFDELRSQILDLGNNQIRNVETELDQYDVKWNKYHLDLPVRMGGNKNE